MSILLATKVGQGWVRVDDAEEYGLGEAIVGVTDDGEKVPIYAMTVYHQLHCLVSWGVFMTSQTSDHPQIPPSSLFTKGWQVLLYLYLASLEASKETCVPNQHGPIMCFDRLCIYVWVLPTAPKQRGSTGVRLPRKPELFSSSNKSFTSTSSVSVTSPMRWTYQILWQICHQVTSLNVSTIFDRDSCVAPTRPWSTKCHLLWMAPMDGQSPTNAGIMMLWFDGPPHMRLTVRREALLEYCYSYWRPGGAPPFQHSVG